ncbi:hypothetical protein GOODEAATRI_002009 [Goodea atripinnis]|uniref:Uncharacterized protein n=1 Tax=Goodea atripinnis TaxID=208336 RepID=A0ABV0MEM3_9TELE
MRRCITVRLDNNNKGCCDVGSSDRDVTRFIQNNIIHKGMHRQETYLHHKDNHKTEVNPFIHQSSTAYLGPGLVPEATYLFETSSIGACPKWLLLMCRRKTFILSMS